jgi:hypothetical protein
LDLARPDFLTLEADVSQIDTCHGCGNQFERTALRLCPGCSLSDDRRFDLVKSYLRDNGGAPMRVVSEETGIPLREIARFRDEGRLVVDEGRAT